MGKCIFGPNGITWLAPQILALKRYSLPEGLAERALQLLYLSHRNMKVVGTLYCWDYVLTSYRQQKSWDVLVLEEALLSHTLRNCSRSSCCEAAWFNFKRKRLSLSPLLNAAEVAQSSSPSQSPTPSSWHWLYYNPSFKAEENPRQNESRVTSSPSKPSGY